MLATFPSVNRSIQAGPASERVLAEGEAACFYHAEKRAVVPCNGCGRFLCAVCDIELQGKHFCPACVESGAIKGGIPELERGRRRYDHMIWSLLILPLPLCMFVVPFTASMALVLVFLKWRSATSLVANVRVRLTLGAGLAFVELALSAGFWIMAFVA